MTLTEDDILEAHISGCIVKAKRIIQSLPDMHKKKYFSAISKLYEAEHLVKEARKDVRGAC